MRNAIPRNLLSLQWAVRPEWMRLALDVLARRVELEATPVGQRVALEAKDATPHEDSRQASVRDGVGILPVRGLLSRYSNWLTAWCGGSTYQQLATDFTTLLEDSNVRAIVLALDSPGGEVTGCDEFGAMIYRARGTKPIIAYVDGDACSAAYWIASAAERLVVSPTALVGSIGTLATFFDASERDAREGFREIVLTSSQSPRKSVDPTQEAGQREIIAVLDALAQVFIESVARNRGVTTDTVLSDFGRGGVFVGRAAVAQGMADEVGDFESLLASLATSARAVGGVPLRQAITQENGMRTAKADGAAGARVLALAQNDAVTIRGTRDVTCVDGDPGTVVEVLENVTVAAVETAQGVVRYLLDSELETRATAEAAPVDTATTESQAAADSPAVPADGASPDAVLDLDAFEAAHPAACAAIRAAAATAERERVLRIQSLAKQGPADVLHACLEDPACGYEMAAARMLEAATAKRSARKQAIQSDDQGIPIPAAETPATESGTEARVSFILAAAAKAEGRS